MSTLEPTEQPAASVTDCEKSQSPENLTQRNPFQRLLQFMPGVVLTSSVAWLGLQASDWIGKDLLGFANSPVSAIMLAIVFGLLLGNVLRLPTGLKPGIMFSVKRVLRVGIILLGIRLSLGDVVRLGALGLPLIIVCLTGALVIALWLGKRLALPSRLSALIAIGTSICGATAIVATGPAIEANEEETTYAVANITIFGLLAMLLYPYLANALFADNQTSAGLFLGTSIHETAQVAGGGLIYAQLFQADTALDVATVTKLVRNVMMVFMIPLITTIYRRQDMTREATGKQKHWLSLFPLFILGFLVVACVRTIGDATLESSLAWGMFDTASWSTFTATVKQWAEIFLAIAMAGVGLNTNFKKLRGLGIKPFVVGLAAALSVGGLSLAGITVLQLFGLN
ncbi:MAG: putative sulfate exporter family transporter [Chloroflexi bacterium]|nr:putative sulfate exporter family transporter [Chloroflexota bacterium]